MSLNLPATSGSGVAPAPQLRLVALAHQDRAGQRRIIKFLLSPVQRGVLWVVLLAGVLVVALVTALSSRAQF